MRGRTRNKGPNPLTRSYESNGPDVKIRGTAQHIADKYAQLSRDAHASGDPVASENYLQHAEHYYRLIAAAQEQYRQQYGISREEEGEEGDEEGFGGPSQDRGQGGEEFGDVPNFPQGGYEPRGGERRFDRNDRPSNDRQNNNRQRFNNGERYDRNAGGGGQDRGERYDRQQAGYDRQGGQGGQGGYDRQGAQAGYDRQERPQGDRQDVRPERQDRQDGRQDRPERRERFARDDRPREDRPREERGPRENFGPREGRPEREPRRESGRPVGYGADGEAGGDERDAGGNLPAFLTNPVRPAVSVDEVAESAGLAPPAPVDTAEPEATGIRPRRRRTRKAADAAPEGVDETADGA